MVKIKTKKQLNLPQLIEWAMDNDIKHRVFVSNPNFDGVTYKLGFDIGGDLYFEEALTPTLLFTVEVEEEITEDTEFKSMVEVTTDDLFAVWEHASISTWKNEHSKEFHAYIDGEFKLIWTHEKGLVE
ncbi:MULTISPECIES: hypothetical protein [Staphylococcus]|uniref:hypothetical protein n=1 Tax=Staphylococcus TaxID=1279 RepID=UPI0025567760|nr:hypothetical protein [Staphylococcus equorum]MDK9849748.1 hypothetical protein [Staphylococcus equorum]